VGVHLVDGVGHQFLPAHLGKPGEPVPDEALALGPEVPVRIAQGRRNGPFR
jgi:hypothetical protein